MSLQSTCEARQGESATQVASHANIQSFGLSRIYSYRSLGRRDYVTSQKNVSVVGYDTGDSQRLYEWVGCESAQITQKRALEWTDNSQFTLMFDVSHKPAPSR